MTLAKKITTGSDWGLWLKKSLPVVTCGLWLKNSLPVVTWGLWLKNSLPVVNDLREKNIYNEGDFKESCVLSGRSGRDTVVQSLAVVTALRDIWNLRTEANLLFLGRSSAKNARFGWIQRRKKADSAVASGSDCTTGGRREGPGRTLTFLKTGNSVHSFSQQHVQ